MGYFYEKMLEASAVADAIQDPDNVGNDLNEIEDAIMGDDGIEAHRDEIDDAVEGMIGDPVEEASMLIFESNYNFNQLMKAIGIAELNEACAGRDFFLEGENEKTFKEKVVEFLKTAWAKLCKIYKDVTDFIKKSLPTKKNYITNNREAIERGFKTDWSVEMFDMDALANDKYFQFKSPKDYAGDRTSDEKADIIHHVSGGVIASDIKELESKVTADLFKKVTYTSKDTNLLEMAINLSQSPVDISELEKKHRIIKNLYSKYITAVKADHNANRDMNTGKRDMTRAETTAFVDLIRFESSVVNKLYSIKLKASKARNNQAWQLVQSWKKAGSTKKSFGFGKKKDNAEANNTTTVSTTENSFMNIDII